MACGHGGIRKMGSERPCRRIILGHLSPIGQREWPAGETVTEAVGIGGARYE
jgi:hypothetical protein